MVFLSHFTAEANLKKQEPPLTREEVDSVTRAHSTEIQNCYQESLRESRDVFNGLMGEIKTEFVIGLGGKVTSAYISQSGTHSSELEKCTLSAVKSWQFPNPKGGGLVSISHSFKFEPGKEPDITKEDNLLQDKEIKSVIESHSSEIENCYQKNFQGNKNLAGKIRVQFIINSAGRVTSASISQSGINNSGLENCVISALKSWQFLKPRVIGSVNISYPFTFPLLKEPKLKKEEGTLTKQEIESVIKAHLSEIKICYEKSLQSNKGLSGKIVTQFVIGSAGRVTSASISQSGINNSGLETCIVSAVKLWEFPKPRGNGSVNVSYPFTFSPPN